MKEELEKAEEEGIQFEFLTQPVEASKINNKVALKCLRMKPGPLDNTGRPAPIPVKGSEYTNEYDAVIKAIGEEPDTSFIPAEFLDSKGRFTNTSSGSVGR